MKYIVWIIANTIWFGFFFYVILFKDWNPLCLIVPLLLFHWNIEEIK